MIQGKLEEMTKIQSGFGNYSQELGQIFSKHDGLETGIPQQEEAKGQQSNERLSSVPPNSVATTNGIWDETALRQISGWKKPFKSETLISTMQELKQFHEEMGTVISAKELKIGANEDKLKEPYEELLEKVSHYVHRGSQWYSSFHLHRKEEKAMLPAMSTLLIKLYSLGNVFDNIKNISLDYMLENGKTSAVLSDIITSKMAGSLQGSIAFTGNQANQTDKTAYQMKKQASDGKTYSANDDIKAMRLPSFDNKNIREELHRLAIMIESAELHVTNDIAREQFKIEYGDLLKMIYIFLNEANEREDEKILWKQEDVNEAFTFWNKTAGMTVEEAVKEIDGMRKEKFETASKKSIKAGGSLSGVLIDQEKKRVLRTATGQKDIKQKRDNNNYNYDEAMSRLAEVTGLSSMAGARTTYYKDMEGKLQYGTNMELAGGEAAVMAKLSFGHEETDKRMRAGRYNIFGTESDKELNRNADMIISSYKLQILDYIACHQDRNINNFFLDVTAEDPTMAFMGIDNDNVFGKNLDVSKIFRKVDNVAHATNSYAEPQKSKYLDAMTVLEGFEFIPNEVVKHVEELNPQKINEALKPYLDRSARFAVINRIGKLKEYVKSKSRIMNIRTKEGMEAFKKETLNRMLSVSLELVDEDVEKATVMGAAGMAGSFERKMPGILMRTLMSQYFTMAPFLITKADGSYEKQPELEYIPEGTEKDYITKANIANRQANFWKTFDAMLSVVGKSREQLWDEAMGRKYGEEEMKKKSEEDSYKKLKESFLTGKMRFFNTFQVK